MVKTTVRTIYTGGSSYTGGRANSYKVARSRALVNKAAQLLRQRNAGYPRAPLATRGYYGLYQRRGRDELKVVDVTAAGAVAAAGTVTLLNGISQGTDYNNRIGRKVIIKSLLFNLDLQPNATASIPIGDFVRVLVVYDCQTNSAAPVVSDILQGGTYNSPMNLTNRDRFKVLIDKRVSVGGVTYTAGAITSGMFMPRTIHVFKKMSMEMIFSGTGATVGSISTGGIFLILLDEIGAIVNSNLYSRIRYQDA